MSGFAPRVILTNLIRGSWELLVIEPIELLLICVS